MNDAEFSTLYWPETDDFPARRVRHDEMVAYGAWYEDDTKRVVAKTVVGPLYVSTVFLGIDHNFFNAGPPVLYETMIFPVDGPMEERYTDRYPTRASAVAGHKAAVVIAEEMIRQLREVGA